VTRSLSAGLVGEPAQQPPSWNGAGRASRVSPNPVLVCDRLAGRLARRHRRSLALGIARGRPAARSQPAELGNDVFAGCGREESW